MQRYFIYLAYDGTAYHGWQIQPNGDSVQECLMRALAILMRREVEVIGAGRTDAGVHAALMVAHFDSDEPLDTAFFTDKLNRLLPPDISVSAATVTVSWTSVISSSIFPESFFSTASSETVSSLLSVFSCAVPEMAGPAISAPSAETGIHAETHTAITRNLFFMNLYLLICSIFPSTLCLS